jgi:NAD(P)H-hydrate repair Nnr-like enzyme with NAD(P)H-hydrate epimerase domain
MKIFTNAQLHELDQYTIEHEPISSLNLMERAAKALTNSITAKWDKTTPFVVFEKCLQNVFLSKIKNFLEYIIKNS